MNPKNCNSVYQSPPQKSRTRVVESNVFNVDLIPCPDYSELDPLSFAVKCNTFGDALHIAHQFCKDFPGKYYIESIYQAPGRNKWLEINK